MNFNPHPWQIEAFKKVDAAYNAGGNVMMSIAACVGSGKTAVAAYAFGKFIKLHENEKTISMFVAPRINLCNQQEIEIAGVIDSMFGLKAATENTKGDYKIWLVNCESEDSYKNNNNRLYSRHNIFVICDESLWGNNDKATAAMKIRFNTWIGRFNRWQKAGYLFGGIAYDEAHNYENKLEEMTSTDLTF